MKVNLIRCHLLSQYLQYTKEKNNILNTEDIECDDVSSNLSKLTCRSYWVILPTTKWIWQSFIFYITSGWFGATFSFNHRAQWFRNIAYFLESTQCDDQSILWPRRRLIWNIWTCAYFSVPPSPLLACGTSIVRFELRNIGTGAKAENWQTNSFW